jgi:DNA-binding CsgD family transcriptional regulator
MRVLLVTIFIVISRPDFVFAIFAGAPPTINFPKSTYQAAGKNWSVTQDRNGIMYFGNDDGLLEYDGSRWSLHPLRNINRVRSVFFDKLSERIYVGSFQEFGYFERDKKGVLEYNSLSDRLTDHQFSNEDIWQIIGRGDVIYFQSFRNIFIYNSTTGKLTVLDPPGNLIFIFKTGDEITGHMINGGLFRVAGEILEEIPGTDKLAGQLVHSILPYKEGGLLIGTSTGGLYIYNDSSLHYWDVPASEYLIHNHLNRGLKIDDNNYLYGTIQNGLVRIDSMGNILQIINVARGLQNNTVLSLFADNMNNVWAGLNRGIDKILIESPYTIFTDRSGKTEAVITAVLYNDILYIGTNKGVFYKPWESLMSPDASTDNFKMVPGTNGMAWELKVFDDQLICGHNEGTFLIKNPDEIVKLSPVTGGWNIIRVPDARGDFLVQSTYTDLVVYKKDGSGQWKLSHTVQGYQNPSRYVDYDNYDNLWISHESRGIYRARLNETLDSVSSLSYYSNTETDIPSEMDMFRVGNLMLFISGNKIFRYDPFTNSFNEDQTLMEQLGDFQGIEKIITENQNLYWFITGKRFALASFGSGYLELVEKHYPDHYNINLVEGHMNIVRLNDSLRLFGTDNGFCLFSPAGENAYHENPNRLLIRRVNSSSGILPVSPEEYVKLPFKNNFLNFTFAFPSRNTHLFIYKLEGLDESWHEASTAKAEFNRLPAGSYTFRLKALSSNGETAGSISYYFTILPPWYASIYAWLFYFALALLLVFVIRTYYKRRYDHKKELIKARIQKEKDEQLKMAKIESEKKFMELENKRLEEEIKYKSNELANSTLSIIKKNEILKEIKKDIITKSKKGEYNNKSVMEVIDLINKSLRSDEDWQVFLSNFDLAHENFLKRLKSRYPDLTPKDLRFCAYLRMNISSKEIASLLNISVRGVEIKRYRLRKKLLLNPENDLVEFVMEI